MVHLATLVHDDVLDEAQMRHGLPSANVRWGNEISVLLGDCLFARALQLGATYPTTEVCRRISAAANTVCAGEILQTQARFNLDLHLGRYLDIIRMKTGALFAVSCELGAWLNDSEPSVVELFNTFGTTLGMAYQIYDDCIDVFGQEVAAGKSLGTDMTKGKPTLPFLLLRQHLGDGKREALDALLFSADPCARQQMGEMAAGNGVAAESRAAIEQYIGRARAALAGLPANSHRQALEGLVDYLSAQSGRLLEDVVN